MPKPEHIEALAAEMWGDHEAARLILDAITREPAVQDAVLAALVEGGRLVEQLGVFRDGDPRMDGSPRRVLVAQPKSREDAASYLRTTRAPESVRVRLVEPEWRDAP